MTFTLTTTTRRVILVEAGQPITALARDEFIETVSKEGSEPLSEAEVDWVRSHVAPLMRPWGM